MTAGEVAGRAIDAIVQGDGGTIGDDARAQALRLMLTRFSVSPKHLVEPGPGDDEIATVVLAALRGSDHEKLVPFRFVVARGEGLARLADLFVDYGRRRGKTGAALDAERERAMQAPVVLAVVARIDAAHPDVPAHEQWVGVGGAVTNALMALHVLGYAGKMLSGERAADPTITRAYCGEGETLLGWISAGTPGGPPRPRGEIDPATVLRYF